MRNTLALLTWAMQGLAHANRSRRERLAGVRPPLTGADAMHVYLKDHGIDVPHLDKLIKGLMRDGKTAGAVKELVTIAADAAANPHDLGAFVQHLARCCAPTTDGPPAPPVVGLAPAAAPPGTSWTATDGQQPHFRPEFTSAARRGPPTPTAAPPPTDAPSDPVAPSGQQPRFRPEFTSEARRRPSTAPATSPDVGSTPAPTAAAANDAGAARPTSAESAMTKNDAATTAGCNDPISEALRPEDLARLVALERRVDAFEARVARELLELKDWMSAQFQDLSRRIEAKGAREARMQAELDELRAQLQRVESELRAVTRLGSTPAETPSACMAASHDVAAQGELPVQERVRDPGGAEGTERSEDAGSDASAIDAPKTLEAAQRGESQVEQTSGADHEGSSAGAQVERQDIGAQREPAEPAASDPPPHATLPASEPQVIESARDEGRAAEPVKHEAPVEVANLREASPMPLPTAHPRSLDERIEAAEARIEAGLQGVAELKSDVVQRVGELFQKLEMDKASPTASAAMNASPSEA